MPERVSDAAPRAIIVEGAIYIASLTLGFPTFGIVVSRHCWHSAAFGDSSRWAGGGAARTVDKHPNRSEVSDY